METKTIMKQTEAAPARLVAPATYQERVRERVRAWGLPGQDAGRLRFDVSMASLTSFRVGGPADVVYFPAAAEEIADVIRRCRLAAIPVTLLGNGTNVVVADAGIRGLVVVFGEPYARMEIEARPDGSYVVAAGAGALLSGVANRCAAAGLTGLEFAAGIPGSVGGAVFMNAGAYGGAMADVVLESRVLDASLRLTTVAGADHGFGYRYNALTAGGAIILETRLLLQKGDPTAIRARIAELNERRRCTQPLEWPSAGSVFKRPNGYYAGKLIAESELCGLHEGGAQVSEKHAGFIINTGGARASDIRALVDRVTDRVLARTGVRLETEIRFVGDW